MTKKIFPILLIASFLLSACGTAGSGGVEQTPPAAEPFTQAAPTATAEAAKTPGVDVPVSPEEIAADGELKPVEGDDFQNLRKAFEESPISFYDAATGQLSQSETAGEVGFTVLAANKVSIGGVETGETILFGEYPGGRVGYFVQGADGAIAGTQAWRFAGVDGVEEQVLFVGESGEVVSLSSDARVEPIFGYEYSTETGAVSTFYVFDADGVAHEVPGMAGVGKVAALPQIEGWYRAAQELREESGEPEKFSWKYTEKGELTLVRWVSEVKGEKVMAGEEPNIDLREVQFFWNEEAGVWEERVEYPTITFVNGKGEEVSVIDITRITEGAETEGEQYLAIAKYIAERANMIPGDNQAYSRDVSLQFYYEVEPEFKKFEGIPDIPRERRIGVDWSLSAFPLSPGFTGVSGVGNYYVFQAYISGFNGGTVIIYKRADMNLETVFVDRVDVEKLFNFLGFSPEMFTIEQIVENGE